MTQTQAIKTLNRFYKISEPCTSGKKKWDMLFQKDKKSYVFVPTQFEKSTIFFLNYTLSGI